MKYEALLRIAWNRCIENKIRNFVKKKKKKGRNHVNIINKYFLPCFHFLIRESCPFFFLLCFLFIIIFCLFVSFFILFNFYKLSFFLSVKKKFVYTDRSCRLIEKNTICVCIHGVIVYLYGVLISCMCIFDLDVDAKRIYFCNKPNIFYKKLTKEYESIFAYVCVYLCIFAIFLHAYRWISYYTISPESNEKLQNFFYNFHSLCHLALI